MIGSVELTEPYFPDLDVIQATCSHENVCALGKYGENFHEIIMKLTMKI